jgi:hypothetical protein
MPTALISHLNSIRELSRPRSRYSKDSFSRFSHRWPLSCEPFERPQVDYSFWRRRCEDILWRLHRLFVTDYWHSSRRLIWSCVPLDLLALGGIVDDLIIRKPWIENSNRVVCASCEDNGYVNGAPLYFFHSSFMVGRCMHACLLWDVPNFYCGIDWPRG